MSISLSGFCLDNSIMRRLFFYLILFCISKSMNGQISGTYELDYTYYAKYYIEFHNNYYYFMEIAIYLSDDVVFFYPQSFGKYTEDNNKIILTDHVHGFQIVLLREDEDLIVISLFSWIKDKQFKYYGEVYDNSNLSEALEITKDMPLSLEQERKEYQLSSVQTYPLKNGKYSGDEYYPFELYLSADSTYSMEFRIGYWDIAFFEGTWSRNGNELILCNANLQCNFYMLIGEDKLISKLLPGDYEGITLYYKGTK